MECDGVTVRQHTYGLWIIAIVTSLSWANRPVLAESLPATSVQDALKNIKQFDGSCSRKDAIKPKTPALVQVAEVKPDLSCAIAPKDLAHHLQSPDTVLVDTRSATDFANFHIDGAMNISPSELRSKTFLSKKSVVLMGNGKAEREQYIDCKRLKSNGFKQVKVLHGGMPSWLISGQAILGLAPNTAQLTRLTPSDLWIESQFEANLVLVTSGQKVLQNQLKDSVLLSDENPKTIQKAIEYQRKQSKSGNLAAVVLVSDKGFDFQTLSQAIKPLPLLVYYETAEAFTQYVVQQNTVWTAQARGPKQPSGCGR